ncbi:MAG TPA: hypothetical protein VFQ79_08105 [Bryobacteraceae bacterium]|nr:hypothetical protein [Bryobacteraceae bacterium]
MLRYCYLFLLVVPAFADQHFAFDYRRELLGSPPSLSIAVTAADSATGVVVINGGDTRQPSTPFTFDWGDGQTTSGFFPQQHRYAQVKNYIVTVAANYGGGETDRAQALTRLVPPAIQPVPLPSGFDVTVALSGQLPTSRLLYAVLPTLAPFATTDFSATPRVTIEYVLSAIAAAQKDLINDDITLINGAFRQQVWKDTAGGFYSIWYANPVSIAAGNHGFAAAIPWSSLAHEIGHNFTLNFPSGFIYGGRVDGNANAIYSETMAQIFQHAVIHEVVNNSTAWGLSSEIAFELAQDARTTISVVRQNYENYLRTGKPFATWNNPSTPTDETLQTFMTLAYLFLANVEQAGTGYRIPVKRLTKFLQRFNTQWQSSYAPSENTVQADTFRSTLMAAAISYGVGRDLRLDFRTLGFPVDNAIYDSLNIGLENEITTKILPQFAFGGGWYSALYLTNTSTNPVYFTVDFVGDNGERLIVPRLGSSSINASLGRRATAVVEAPNVGPLNQGFVELSLPSAVVGYGLFRQSIIGWADQEAVVPLSRMGTKASTLIWDERNLVTAVAIVNPGSQSNIVTIVGRDSEGGMVGTGILPMGPKTKVTALLRDLPGMGNIVGRSGSAEFVVDQGSIAVLGLRFGGEAFTSIPTADR